MSKVKRYTANNNSELIKHVFSICTTIDGTASEKHLDNHDVTFRENFQDDSGKNGLWHCEQMPYYEEINSDGETHPAMISVIRNNAGKMIGIYVIYLDEQGDIARLKHPVTRIMNNYDGHDAVIRLGDKDQDTIICLSVGIIQTLSIKDLIGEDLAYWAVLDARSFHAFEPPEWCLGVYMFVANEYKMQQLRSAIHLKTKLIQHPFGIARGCVPIYCPLDDLKNWNEVLKEDPNQFNLMRPVL